MNLRADCIACLDCDITKLDEYPSTQSAFVRRLSSYPSPSSGIAPARRGVTHGSIDIYDSARSDSSPHLNHQIKALACCFSSSSSPLPLHSHPTKLLTSLSPLLISLSLHTSRVVCTPCPCPISMKRLSPSCRMASPRASSPQSISSRCRSP